MRMMTRDFKMHRADPSRAGITPLGQRSGRAAGRARLAGRGAQQVPENDTVSRPAPAGEIGGPSGPEPTRYGDWERNGICYDF